MFGSGTAVLHHLWMCCWGYSSYASQLNDQGHIFFSSACLFVYLPVTFDLYKESAFENTSFWSSRTFWWHQWWQPSTFWPGWHCYILFQNRLYVTEYDEAKVYTFDLDTNELAMPLSESVDNGKFIAMAMYSGDVQPQSPSMRFSFFFLWISVSDTIQCKLHGIA